MGSSVPLLAEDYSHTFVCLLPAKAFVGWLRLAFLQVVVKVELWHNKFAIIKTIHLKKSELIFNVISVPVDFLMILTAASLAYFLRYRVETLPVLFELSYADYLKLVLIASPFLLGLFALTGLYTQKSTRGVWKEIGKLLTAVSAGLMIVVVAFFFNKNLFPSRLIVLMGWGFAILFAGLARVVLLVIQRQLLARGMGRHRVIVIAKRQPTQIIEDIQNDSKLGYEIVGKLAYDEQTLVEIERMHREKRLDELMQLDTTLGNDEILNLVDLCEDLGIKFNYLPSLLESHLSNIEIDVIGSMPVIRLKPTPLDGWGKVAKRIIDIVFSLLGLILFSPLFALISLVIKLNSKGTVFFHQRRGSTYHNFEFYKFRSMYAELSEGTTTGDRMSTENEV